MIPVLAFLLGIVALVAPVLVLRSSAMKSASRGAAQAIAIGAVLFTMLIITMAAIMSPFAWMGVGLGALMIALIGASILSSAARGGVGDPLSQQEVERLLRVDFTADQEGRPVDADPSQSPDFEPSVIVSPTSAPPPAPLAAMPPHLALPPVSEDAAFSDEDAPDSPPPPRLDA